MVLRVDQVQRRATARRDPRAEPDSSDEGELASDVPPPAESGPTRAIGHTEDTAARAVPAPAESGSTRESGPVEPPASGRISVVTSADPRLAELDPLLSHGSWREILKLLGPPEAVEKLPPTLALIYAVAQRESAGNASATPANELAIRSMAAIYGIAPGSTTALVLAKRLLRQNPAAWRTKPAPPAKLSALIIAVALAFGAGVGWWLSVGSNHLF